MYISQRLTWRVLEKERFEFADDESRLCLAQLQRVEVREKGLVVHFLVCKLHKHRVELLDEVVGWTEGALVGVGNHGDKGDAQQLQLQHPDLDLVLAVQV